MSDSALSEAPTGSLAFLLLDEGQRASWPAVFTALGQRVAATGLAADQYLLGRCFQLGRGTNPEEAEAGRFFRLAADQGHAQAQFETGSSLTSFNRRAEENAEGVRYLRLAADQGHSGARGELARCLSAGVGTAENQVEAVRQARLAADQGDAHGQFTLGVCLEEGRGVAQNLAEAGRYFRLAAHQKSPGARERMEHLLAQAPPDAAVFEIRGQLRSPSAAPVTDVLLHLSELHLFRFDFLGQLAPQADGRFTLAFSRQAFNQGLFDHQKTPNEIAIKVGRLGADGIWWQVYARTFGTPGFELGAADLGVLTIPDGTAAGSERFPS